MIRKDLLIHTVQYHEYNGEDDTWGGSSNFAPPVTLEHVRIEPSTKVYKNANGDVVVHKAVMFFDAILSTPNAWRAKTKSKIVHDGKEYIVNQEEALYKRELHHLEVLLG